MAGILLTGSNGQVGCEFHRRAETAGHSCHGLTREKLDITDRDAVLRIVAALRPAVVINAAAYTAVDRAENEKAAAFAINAEGPAHLADACAAAGIPLIHISTDHVFDGTKRGAYTEEDAVAPLGIYGASKSAGEEAVRRRCAQHIILRTAWVYGVHGHNFVNTMLRLAGERDTLCVVDDQYGCPTFAGDLAEAILKIVTRLRAGKTKSAGFGTFHCAGQGATTWFRFAEKIFEIAAPFLRKRPKVEAITTADYPTAARRPANAVLDCIRLSRIHGISLRPWEVALREMLESAVAAKGRIGKAQA